MKSPRVILDTNVLVSYIVWPGATIVKVVGFAFSPKAQMLTSHATYDEVQRKLAQFIARRAISPDKVEILLAALNASARWISILQHVEICRDPNDDKFLSLAMNGEADYLVTGDQDLLVLKKIGRTKILTPADFIKAMKIR